MALTEVTRSTWTDDDGSGTTGSIIDNAELQAIYDNVDGIFTDTAVDAVEAAGGLNSDIRVTAGEAIDAGEVCYIKSDGKAWLTDADDATKSTEPIVVGVVPAAIGSGSSGLLRLKGKITGLSGLTAGANQYVSSTPGALTETATADSRVVGVAETTTVLVVVPAAHRVRTRSFLRNFMEAMS